MSEYAIVRINEKLIPEFQINYNPSSGSATKHGISSWTQIQLQENQKLLVMVAANLVLNTHVTIPSKNEEVIRQSIPFAVEEQLANEIEDNHFAYIHQSEKLFLVSIINKTIISKIKQQLNQNNLKCDLLCTEIFSVPSEVDNTVVCESDNNYIINTNNEGTCIKRELIDHYLKLLKTNNITVYSNSDSHLIKNKLLNLKQTDTNILQAKTITSANNINLFQGKFSQDVDKNKNKNSLKKLLGLVAVLVVSWVIINSYQLWTLSSKINEIKHNQKTLLLQYIPNANQSELNDPFAAIQSRLQQTQFSQGSNSNNSFIQSLAYLGKTLTQHPTIQVQSLRQRKIKLEIKLQAPNVSALNRFQADLEKNTLSMQIKTGTRSTNTNGISSVITMEQL